MENQTFLERATNGARRYLGQKIFGDGDLNATPYLVEHANARLRGETKDSEASAIYGLHNILKYHQYDENSGLFFNDNSVSFCFYVIAQTGADDDMVARLTTLFTPIPPNSGVQWTLFGNPHLDAELEAYVDMRRVAHDNDLAPDFFTELAKMRTQYFKRNKGRPLFKNSNYVVKNLQLVFSVTREGSYKDTALVEEMADLRETLNASLKTSGLPAFSMDAEGLIRYLTPILNPEYMFSEESLPEFGYDDGKSIRDQLTSLGQHVRVKSRHLLFGPPPDETDTEDSRVAVRTFGILKYPKRKELWQMSNIIGSFFDDGLQYPCPFMISAGFLTQDPNQVENTAQLKSIRAQNNAKSRMAEYQPELALQAADWRGVMHQLGSGGSMCQLYHTLTLFSPIRAISKAEAVAKNIWRNEQFLIEPINMVQLASFYSALPMTLTESGTQDLKKMKIVSQKTTVNAVDMSPVIGEWKGAGDPVLMYYGRRGTPVFHDLYSNKQGNYNLFVAGVSGSGKTVFMNELVSAYRSIGAQAWVIDVGRGYRNLIKMTGGNFIEFDAYSKLCMNPFTWIGTDSENTFEDEMSMLRPMIGRMASPDASLTPYQNALLSRAITEVYNDYGNDSDPTKIAQFLKEKMVDERGQIDRDAYQLGVQLYPFTTEGVYGRYFNGKANISLDADMVGLELEELKKVPDLRRIVLFAMTSRIANAMYMSRESKKICLIDEAWQLLGDDAETAGFIEEGYRRARKYRGIFALGTQGIEDAFKNAASQAAYNNADWKVFLRQDRKNLEKLIEDGKVNFTPAIKRMLLSLRTEAGQFSELLISSPNGESVVRNILDPFSLLMTASNPEDYSEVDRLLNQGVDTFTALKTILAQRGYHA